MATNTATTDTIDSNETLGTIDPLNVMGEVERFAQTYGKINDRLLDATEILVRRKGQLDSIEAELDLTVRKSAEIAGEKVTEKKVASAVQRTEQWQKARAAVDEAESTVDRCKLALKTLDKKDRMLELLARAQIKELNVNSRTQ